MFEKKKNVCSGSLVCESALGKATKNDGEEEEETEREAGGGGAVGGKLES